MLDFLQPTSKWTKNGYEIYPEFIVKKSKDIMIRGNRFYAIWDEENGIWSTDVYRAFEIIDNELDNFVDEHFKDNKGNVRILYLRISSTGCVDKFYKYCEKQMADNFKILDQKILFLNDPIKKEDYSSKRLDYPLEKGNINAWDEMMSILYEPEEREKIEWSIGSIVTGDSKKIQKFIVLYGAAGTGKSTVLDIITTLFKPYTAMFDAKALGSKSDSFALEPFKNNPLVGIQHDGDLSRIEDNTRINSLVSHEAMPVNEKFKSIYTTKFNTFLYMGTNTPVKISEAKSGITRRLIDVKPTGNKIPYERYLFLKDKIPFELGGIAYHCREVFLNDPNLYDGYISRDMIESTNDFYNFIEENHFVFKKEKVISLKMAWELYKNYTEEAKIPYSMSKRAFKHELKNYFKEYVVDVLLDDGTRVYDAFMGFNDMFDDENKKQEDTKEKIKKETIDFKEQHSLLDEEFKDCIAQYAHESGRPEHKWVNVKTTLKDIDTSRIHYVKIPEQHIVIDFDIPDAKGNKSFEKNLEAASKWPKTYAELSKSGSGIHLHYIYNGDVSKLSNIYDDHIEIKTLHVGDSALRRRLTKCNNTPIATISSGLPLKGDKPKVINNEVMFNEKAIRTLIKRNLNKEYHPGTKPSIDYIYKILNDAYNNGTHYDVSDLKTAVMAFAMQSTNQADYCVKLVAKMKFKSEEPSQSINSDRQIVFFDIEVFPNLFLVNWKFIGEGKKVIRMINPSPSAIEELIQYNLIGFNCKGYDNHLLYARMIGYDNMQLYKLSKRIIEGDKKAKFGEAYNISYTDIYDYALKKQSLKKWEIELDIHHHELGLNWDEPVPEKDWDKVAEYCDNDVIATEAVFNATQSDYTTRLMLAKLAKMSPNDSTNNLTTKIIFGNNKHPQLVYTDLSTGERSDGTTNPDIINSFPGYGYIKGEDGKMHNMYRGTDVGRGGYVYAKPGVYKNVALLDIASQHPHSIVAMNCFGEYTKRFKELLDARILIKHEQIDEAKHMLNGDLAEFLDDPEALKNLPTALKRPINSVYGLTSAAFDNPFRDNRNVNNIVALRGALFMRTLQDEVTDRGYTVVHIKTDSIKIANADQNIIDFCFEFARKYGYEFEHEATYNRICLVNDAVYIAKYSDDELNGKHAGEWTATGTEFQVPYIFKKLFSHEEILYEDLRQIKTVKSSMYLDFNENLPDVNEFEKNLEKLEKQYKEGKINELEYLTNKAELNAEIEKGHKYHFIGKVGAFVPVKDGCEGGILVRDLNGKMAAVAGSKGYRWKNSEVVKSLDLLDQIDENYFNDICKSAEQSIETYCPFCVFVGKEDIPDNFISI